MRQRSQLLLVRSCEVVAHHNHATVLGEGATIVPAAIGSVKPAVAGHETHIYFFVSGRTLIALPDAVL